MAQKLCLSVSPLFPCLYLGADFFLILFGPAVALRVYENQSDMPPNPCSLEENRAAGRVVYGLWLTGDFVSQSASSHFLVPRERPFLELARASAAASLLSRIPL